MSTSTDKIKSLFNTVAILNEEIAAEIKRLWPVGSTVEFPRVFERNNLIRGRVDGHKKQGGVGVPSLIVIDEATNTRLTRTISRYNLDDIKVITLS